MANRYQPIISRNADFFIDEDHWLKQFEKKLQKGAVQSRSVEESFIEQMNGIMNNKSRYSSVIEAVNDMKQRSGLTDYLNKTSNIDEVNSEVNKKVAQNNSKKDTTPIVIKKCPKIGATLENYIRDNKGNLPIPAIIDKIRSIHQKDVTDASDWEDENLIRLVSKMNLEAKKNNPDNHINYSNLGRRDNLGDSEIDPSNVDAFHALMPAK